VARESRGEHGTRLARPHQWERKMLALAMRPRRGGHAVQDLGADIAGCAAGTGCAAEKAAAGTTCTAAADAERNSVGAADAERSGLGAAVREQIPFGTAINERLRAGTAVNERMRLRWPLSVDRLLSPSSAEAEEKGKRARSARLAELAEQVRRICRRGTVDLPPCASGLAELDEVLGGGFVRAAIHELIAGCEGAAARSIALLTAVQAAGQHKSILFIDSTGDFYPPGAAQLGVPLERLIIVRPAGRVDALWACEQALRCTALAAVIASLPRSLETQISRRLQLAAEAGRSIGLLIYPQSASASQARRGSSAGQTFAATRVSLEPLDSCSRASSRYGESPTCWAELPRSARRLRVRILKLREGQPIEAFEPELPDPNPVLPRTAESPAMRPESVYVPQPLRFQEQGGQNERPPALAV
jgi:protein ImuA